MNCTTAQLLNHFSPSTEEKDKEGKKQLGTLNDELRTTIRSSKTASFCEQAFVRK